MRKIFSPNVILLHAALLLTSFLFVYVFSYSTSPRYPLLGSDSAVFQVIGKYWAQGCLPYVDLFDHKGPLIFFLNALGYAIYPRAGVMLPQIACLYLSCLFLWRAIGLYWRGGRQVLCFALTLIYYAAHYWEGNNPGEYTMPFLAASTYCFLRCLKDDVTFCPPIYGFVYGLSFGGCVMIHASNAMPTCCFVLLTTIFLRQARAFKNLRQNFLSFWAGFATVVVPFALYFAAHGALYEMFFGTILLNVTCATASKVDYSLALRPGYSFLHLMPIFLTIFFGALLLARERKDHLARSAVFVGVMTATLLMNLRLYTHYYMMVVPTLPILFAVLKRFGAATTERLSAKFLRTLAVFVTAVYAMVCVLSYCVPFAKCFNSDTLTEAEEKFQSEVQGVRDLAAIIPDKERDSFACWGNFYSTSHWILETDMRPRERFFTNNTNISLLEPSLKREWLWNVRREPPLWILYGTNAVGKTTYKLDERRGEPDVERLLAARYALRGSVVINDQTMQLWRRKDNSAGRQLFRRF